MPSASNTRASDGGFMNHRWLVLMICKKVYGGVEPVEFDSIYMFSEFVCSLIAGLEQFLKMGNVEMK